MKTRQGAWRLRGDLKVLRTIIAFFISITTAACVDLGPEPARSKHGVTVQVWGARAESAVYEALAGFVELENPDLDVALVQVFDETDHLLKLTARMAAGDPPDVFLVNYREYAQFVHEGAIEPVGPLLNRIDIDTDDLSSVALEAFTYQGILQCIPQNVSSLVVYVNRSLFEDAGVEVPKARWTWQRFREAAIALTGGGIHGLGLEPHIARVAPFVWSNGGELVDDYSAPSRFTLREPKARAALEFLVSLVRDDHVVPNEEEVAALDLETRFITGKLGMLLSSRRFTSELRENPYVDWDVVLLPVAQDPASVLHSDAFCISRGSHTDGALEFVEYVVGQQGQTVLAASGRTVPSNVKVARSSVFLDPNQPPEHDDVFLEALPHIRLTPVIHTWAEIEDLSEEVLRKAFYEPDYHLDDALEELDRITRPLFVEALGG